MGLLNFLQENPDVSRCFYMFMREPPTLIQKYLVRDIADAGADFITSHLRLEDVFCYWKSLLLSYTALLDYTVVRDPSLSEVKPRKL